MSRLWEKQKYLSNLTPQERLQVTLKAQQGRGSGRESFVLPLDHDDKHFIKWCFMVRYPWAADPVRGVWKDPIRSRLVKETYLFTILPDTTSNGGDIAVFGLSDTSSCSYCALKWGPPVCRDTSNTNTTNADWRLIPQMSWNGTVGDNSGDWTKTRSNPLTLTYNGKGDYENSSSRNNPCCTIPITGRHYSGGAGGSIKTTTVGCGPLMAAGGFSPIGMDSIPSYYRPLACGCRFTFTSSAEKRKGTVYFLETDHHDIMEYRTYDLAQILAGYSGNTRIRGVRRYPLIGSTSDFHQVWHPVCTADHVWLAQSLDPYTDNNTPYAISADNYTYTNGSVSAVYKCQSMLMFAGGVDPSEICHCEMTHIYEKMDQLEDGALSGYGIVHPAALVAGSKMAGQYQRNEASHVGEFGAPISHTSEHAARGVL